MLTLSNNALLMIGAVCTSILIFNIILANRGLVQIGISETMDKTKRHGVVYVADGQGGMVRRSFLADRPERLNHPHDAMLRNMFYQVAKMGFNPQQIEILVNKKVQLYKYDNGAIRRITL